MPVKVRRQQLIGEFLGATTRPKVSYNDPKVATARPFLIQPVLKAKPVA